MREIVPVSLGVDPAGDIETVTVNRWPRGHAYGYNRPFDPDWSEVAGDGARAAADAGPATAATASARSLPWQRALHS